MAYQLLAILTAKWNEVNDSSTIQNMLRNEEDLGRITVISRILLREPLDCEEVFLAWIVCCFIPYARSAKSPSSKFPRTLAAAAAREGIKTDNKTTKIIEEASIHLPDVIMTRELVISRPEIAQPSSRELFGKALLRWGAHWRSIVIFALLVEITEAKDDSGIMSYLSLYNMIAQNADCDGRTPTSIETIRVVALRSRLTKLTGSSSNDTARGWGPNLY